MRPLKIKHLRENPWLVLLHELPAQPDLLLLRAALIAAEYCRNSERLFMEAACDGRYAICKWFGRDVVAAFENSKFFYDVADAKVEEISLNIMNVLNVQIYRMAR